jgi:serine protease Do
VADSEVGKTVRVVVFRDGKTETLRVTLGRREEAVNGPAEDGGAVPEEGAAEQEKEFLGLTIGAITEEMRSELNLAPEAQGLVILNVDETSAAWEKGLRAGDVITEAGQNKIATIADFEAQIKAAKESGRKSLFLMVRRAGEPRFVALNLGE